MNICHKQEFSKDCILNYRYILDASVDWSWIPSLIVPNEGKVICFQSAISKKEHTDQHCNSKCDQLNQNLQIYSLSKITSFQNRVAAGSLPEWEAGKLVVMFKSSTKKGLRQAPSDPQFHPTCMLKVFLLHINTLQCKSAILITRPGWIIERVYF